MSTLQPLPTPTPQPLPTHTGPSFWCRPQLVEVVKNVATPSPFPLLRTTPFHSLADSYWPRVPLRLHCNNVWGLSKNLSDLILASSQYDLLLSSETLITMRRHMSELLGPEFGRTVLLCRDMIPRTLGAGDRYGTFRHPNFELLRNAGI